MIQKKFQERNLGEDKPESGRRERLAKTKKKKRLKKSQVTMNQIDSRNA